LKKPLSQRQRERERERERRRRKKEVEAKMSTVFTGLASMVDTQDVGGVVSYVVAGWAIGLSIISICCNFSN
jgi:hypothetical protein